MHIVILHAYTLAISPILGVADNTKKTTKTMGVLLCSSSKTRDPAEFGWHCWSNAAHPLHLPQLTSLHRCHFPYCPYHRVASTRQPCGNSKCQSELHHNRLPLISTPRTLTCLPHIHPPIFQGSLYSIHPSTQT